MVQKRTLGESHIIVLRLILPLTLRFSLLELLLTYL